MTKAFINPKMLTWARKQRKYSVAAAACAAGVSVDTWRTWELGIDHPSFSEMNQVAQGLSVPFGFFWLSKPPDTSIWRKLRDLFYHD